MISGYSPIIQAFLGTLLTWGLTAFGSAFVFFVPANLNQNILNIILDISLGFAAGVMMAASFWSLLSPAIEIAQQSNMYGQHGEYAFLPVSIGFLIGGLFIYIADKFIPDQTIQLAVQVSSDSVKPSSLSRPTTIYDDNTSNINNTSNSNNLRKRHKNDNNNNNKDNNNNDIKLDNERQLNVTRRRMFLLILAVTVHNFPEGLAVGVGFGAVGSTASRSFDEARKLAIGIGLQNFPEGLAVSLPLMKLGFPRWKAFWYGQLSGLVELFAGVIGAAAVQYVNPILPYALSFAAGAMIYVVVHDLIPEASKNMSDFTSLGCMIGFAIMMSMDVAL